MIQLGDTVIDLSDPIVIAALIGLLFFALLMVLVILSLRASARSARAVEPIAAQMGILGEHVRSLNDGQNELRGGIEACV